MDAPDGGVARLDRFVAERLATLRITRAELARRGGPSRSTLNKAITGDRPLSRATLARLDSALGWAPGSAAAIMRGGTPSARLPRTARGDLCSAEHAHVLAVLQTVEGMLGSCRELINELLVTPRSGGHAG